MSYGNPYDPYGSAPYDGGGAAPGPVERPGPLNLAVRLMYVGAGISLLSVLATFLILDDIRQEAQERIREENLDVDVDAIVGVSIAIGVGVGLLAVGLWILMAVMNGRGHNWARITATVLGALSLCSTVTTFSQPATSSVSLVFSLVTMVLAVAIVVLLWQPSSSAYFRSRK